MRLKTRCKKRGDIEGIAFDLDGTLYPNYRFNIRLLPFLIKEWRLLSAFGKTRIIIRNLQEKIQKNIPGGKFSDFVSQFPVSNGDFYELQSEITAKILGVPAQPLKEKIEKMIYRGWEEFFKKIKLFKHVRETLTSFKNAGYKLGLLSDFPPGIKLDHLKLNNLWDAVHCSETSGALKPHPLSFTKLAAGMDLPCEKIIYVGNSHSYDVTGAFRAGMKTALIKWPLAVNTAHKKPKPDFSFSNYRQLYDFMLE